MRQSRLPSRRKPIREPGDLAVHDCIAVGQITEPDAWSFASDTKGGLLKPVRVRSRLAVSSAESAIASAVEGSGVICVYSYQVERELQQGSLALVLERFEPPPMPVHVIYAEVRLAAAKARAFVDLVVPKLKAELTRIGRRVAGATALRPRSTQSTALAP